MGSRRFSLFILTAFGLHFAITKNNRSGGVASLGSKSFASNCDGLKNVFQRHKTYIHSHPEPYPLDFMASDCIDSPFSDGHTITALPIATLVCTG